MFFVSFLFFSIGLRAPAVHVLCTLFGLLDQPFSMKAP